MLTKEPEIPQPEAFCEHTMQQNATAAGAPPEPRWRSFELIASPNPLSGFKSGKKWEGRDGKMGKEREERSNERGEEEGKLEQGCRLAKAGPGLLHRELKTVVGQQWRI